jgi:UDP-N-acetylmuramoyl-L-alanyl-D-glutamate--2,6-diaminopimelate ligase
MVSTVAASIGERQIDTGLHTTTPDAPDMQEYLAEMVAAGSAYAVLETTSHGLHQRRVDACEFDIAVITNITHEHLDYHGTFENYRQAKATLFRMLGASARKPGQAKIAVLNADDPSYAYLRAIPADRHVSYALDAPADVTAHTIVESPGGQRFTAVTPAGRFPVQIALPGRYNAANALAAISVAVALGLPVAAIQRGLAAVERISGRMERIEEGQAFTAIVDFAHTPNALDRALTVARTMTTGRVIVVFGCAGLRDRAKRPLMGEVAGRLADFTVITAEDPRTEHISTIMAEIAAGVQAAGRREGEGYVAIAERAVAIAFAVNMAQAGDLVIVTGKGHEQSMCYGTTEYPWDDHVAVREAVRARG